MIVQCCITTATPPVTAPFQYLVVFKNEDGNAKTRRTTHLEWLSGLAAGDKLLNPFDIGALVGYSAVLTPATLKLVLENPDIDYVEADQVVTAL